jgi:hypothetical protein
MGGASDPLYHWVGVGAVWFVLLSGVDARQEPACSAAVSIRKSSFFIDQLCAVHEI